MNTLLMNREGFAVPVDGWYQLAPQGEFAHAQAGLTQVIDAEACAAMCRRFEEEAQGANFAGVLIDFDHDSLDAGKRSEAAGWIVALACRGDSHRGTEATEPGAGEGSRRGAEAQRPGPEAGDGLNRQDAKDAKGSGLWAQIRWSAVGEAAVKGVRYRYLSPVWNRAWRATLRGAAGAWLWHMVERHGVGNARSLRWVPARSALDGVDC